MNDSALRYRRDLERGVLFEDHVCRILYGAGLPFQVFRSRDGQQLWGESTLGLEVKLDESFRETGNLFVEIEERPGIDYDWKPAGIYSERRPWLYAIGDFFTLFIFATTTLCNMHSRGSFRIVGNRTDTGRGFLLPLDIAREWAAHILEIETS